MTAPKPAPPARRMMTALAAVAARSGITVMARTQRGQILWAVVESEGTVASMPESGRVRLEEIGRTGGLFVEVLHEALLTVDSPEADVHLDVELQGPLQDLDERLAARGHRVVEAYPPVAGLQAAAAAVLEREAEMYAQVHVATDASRANTGSVTGTGWIIDFGMGTLPRLKNRAHGRSSILEAELRALQSGLREAIQHVPHEHQAACRFVVRSDSQNAVKLVHGEITHARGLTTGGKAIVESIRRLMTGLQVDLGWVRGHDGDVHNEFADRLAVMARRNAEFGVAEKQAHAMLTDLRHEAAEQLTSYSLAA